MAILIFKITTLGKFTVIFQKPFNDFFHIFGVFNFVPAYLFLLDWIIKKKKGNMEIMEINIKHSNINITLC